MIKLTLFYLIYAYIYISFKLYLITFTLHLNYLKQFNYFETYLKHL